MDLPTVTPGFFSSATNREGYECLMYVRVIHQVCMYFFIVQGQPTFLISHVVNAGPIQLNYIQTYITKSETTLILSPDSRMLSTTKGLAATSACTMMFDRVICTRHCYKTRCMRIVRVEHMTVWVRNIDNKVKTMFILFHKIIYRMCVVIFHVLCLASHLTFSID